MMDEHNEFNPMTADSAAIAARPESVAEIQILECVPFVKEIKQFAKELPFFYNAQFEQQFPAATLDSGMYAIVTDTRYRKFSMTAADVVNHDRFISGGGQNSIINCNNGSVATFAT